MLWLFGQCITLHWHWMVNKMMAASNASNVSNVSNVSNASKVSTVSNVWTVSCQQAQTTYPGWVSIKLLPMDIVSNFSFNLQCRCQLLGWTTMTRCTRQKLPETGHRLSLGQPTSSCFRPIYGFQDKFKGFQGCSEYIWGQLAISVFARLWEASLRGRDLEGRHWRACYSSRNATGNRQLRWSEN